MKLFHSLIYPLLAGSLFCLSCSDDEQETGTKQPSATGEVTFGVDLTAFSTRVTQDGSSWNESARKREHRFLSLLPHRSRYKTTECR